MRHKNAITTKVSANPAAFILFRYWIIIIPLLLLLSPTDIDFKNRIYAIMFFIIFFFTTYRNYKVNTSEVIINYRGLNRFICFIIIFLQIVSVNYAINFYTGQNILLVIDNLFSGVNSYSEYQSYFSENRIDQLPITSRITAILLLTYVKGICLFNIANFFLKSKKNNFIDLIILSFATLTYLLFGIARGTFFEVFEISSAYFYFITLTSLKKFKPNKVAKLSKKFIITTVIISSILIILFILNAIRRYDHAELAFDSICNENFCFQPIGIINNLEYSFYVITVYFANGAYVLSVLFENTLLGNELLYLIPLQSLLFSAGQDNLGVHELLCSNYVGCQFVWVPEIVNFLSIFGIFLIVFTNMTPKINKLENYILRRFNIFGPILIYYIFLLLISLPVADFFTVSSSSIILSFIILILYLFCNKNITKPVKNKI